MRIPWRLKAATRILLRGESKQVNSARMTWFQRAGWQIHARGLFVGCPIELFEYTAKDTFCLALMEGMSPAAAVLEIGCGCLRRSRAGSIRTVASLPSRG
jgi:hypothetical protein